MFTIISFRFDSNHFRAINAIAIRNAIAKNTGKKTKANVSYTSIGSCEVGDVPVVVVIGIALTVVIGIALTVVVGIALTVVD